MGARARCKGFRISVFSILANTKYSYMEFEPKQAETMTKVFGSEYHAFAFARSSAFVPI